MLSETYGKFEKYLEYYDLCGEGKRSLREAAEKICGDENLCAEALRIKNKIAGLTYIYDENGYSGHFEFSAKEFEGKSAQFAAFVYTLAIENMEEIYRKYNIPRDVLTATADDMSVWINRHREWFGEWGFSEYGWLIMHLKGRLFRLGRLQFEMSGVQKAEMYKNVKTGELILIPAANAPALNKDEWRNVLKDGAPCLKVHIPRGGRLDEAACMDSFGQAEQFFPKFLNYDFKAFGCVTWLFDPEFENLLPPDSNILKFQKLFMHLPNYVEDYGGLKYVFVNITKDNIKDAPKDTYFRRKLAEHIEYGGKMHFGGGYRLRQN